MRDRYGWNLFGQSVLVSRRLVEAGVPLVTAMWDCTKEGPDIATLGWDTHWDHFKACEGWLLPGLDRALSALLDDLDARGLSDETLVVCLSEMGRTPQVNGRAGRDHWVGSYCASYSPGPGCGPGPFTVDRTGSERMWPTIRCPRRICWLPSTTCAGCRSDATIADRQGRVLPLYGDGSPMRAILT